MKRILASLLAFGLVAILISGCSAEDTDETSDSTSSGETTVTDDREPVEPDVITLPVNYATPANGEEVGVFDTSEGRIVFVFYPDIAPEHVKRFKAMIKEGFYDGTRFHRCMNNFMIQGGDPQSKEMSLAGMWGTGGYTDSSGKEVNIDSEFNDMTHDRGVLSTARGPDPDSASSQFFVMHGDYPSLDGKYTPWGRLVEGIEVVDRIVKTGNPNPAANGAVVATDAIELKSATIETWPID